MQVRGVLQAVDRSGRQPKATVQLLGYGNLNTFHEGFDISLAIPEALLVAGADCTVEIADPAHCGDGQVVGVSKVLASAPTVEQDGMALVVTDGGGNGLAAVVFGVTYAAPPQVTVSSASYGLGTGTAAATAVTTAGFTISVSGGRPGYALYVAWSATGN